MTKATAKPKSNRTAPPPFRGKCERGFTIVELIVSAVILLIAVVAVVAMVRKSSELQMDDYHRHQARGVATRILETTFAYDSYTMSYTVNVPGATPPSELITLDPAGTPPFVGRLPADGAALSTISGITIDRRDGGEPLEAVASIWVKHEKLNYPVDMSVNTAVVRVRWEEPWGFDSLELSKRLLTEAL